MTASLTTTIRALGCNLTVDVDYTDDGGEFEPEVDGVTVIRVNDQPVQPHFKIEFAELPECRQNDVLHAISMQELHTAAERMGYRRAS